MCEAYFDIRFYVSGKLYASRQWIGVPRVGDKVMLGPDAAKKPYRVRRVVWGVDGQDPVLARIRQAVNVDLRKLP